jgi:hypothetical protein
VPTLLQQHGQHRGVHGVSRNQQGGGKGDSEYRVSEALQRQKGEKLAALLDLDQSGESLMQGHTFERYHALKSPRFTPGKRHEN